MTYDAENYIEIGANVAQLSALSGDCGYVRRWKKRDPINGKIASLSHRKHPPLSWSASVGGLFILTLTAPVMSAYGTFRPIVRCARMSAVGYRADIARTR